MTQLLKKAVIIGVALGLVATSNSYAAAPTAPTNVAVVSTSTANTATNAAQVQVSWTAVTGAIGYYVTATADNVSTSKAVPDGSTRDWSSGSRADRNSGSESATGD